MTDSFPPPQIPVQSTPNPPSPFLKRKFWKLPVWGWGVVVVVALIAIGAGAGGKKDADTAKPVDSTTPSSSVETTVGVTSESTSAAETTEAPTTAAPTTTVAPSTTPAPTTPPTLPGFDEGTFIVGTDVQPGLYIAVVPDDSFGCYWARLKDASGELDAIIANDNVSPNAQVVLEIKKADGAFDSSGCGRWVVYLPPATPVTTFGEGTWVVSQQIVPGRYRSSGDPASFGCYWERKSGLSGEFGDIIANDNTNGPTVVDIKASDVGFKSSGCGTWTKS